MHGAVLNSAAMQKYGISAATKTAAGGVIVRKPGSGEPLGLIMETAFLPVLHQLPRPDVQAEHDGSIAAQQLYASYGITTAQEGATHEADLELMQRVGASGANLIDIVAYPFVTDFDAILAKNPVATWGRYVNRVKLGGGKITLDGSPQGKPPGSPRPIAPAAPAARSTGPVSRPSPRSTPGPSSRRSMTWGCRSTPTRTAMPRSTCCCACTCTPRAPIPPATATSP